MSTPEDTRLESRKRWARSAAGWAERRNAMRDASMPLSVRMIDLLEPAPGQDLLELAAGLGDVGFLAAELIVPGGTLICSDFVPEMLTAAQERAKELEIENVRFRQIDAESIDQPAASLDGVLCRWGYMLMTDAEAALRETRRVLRPGARVVLAAWTGARENLWSSIPMRELVDRGIMERPDPTAPGQFAWSREGVIAEHLEAAGFTDPAAEVVTFAMSYADADDWIATQRHLSPGLRDGLDGLDATTREDVLAAVRSKSADFERPDGSLVIPAASWVAVATA